MTPVLIALLAVFAVLLAATFRCMWWHGDTGPRHRLHRPGLLRSRLRHLIAARSQR